MERIPAPFERERVEELLRLFGKATRAHQLYLPNNPVYKAAHDALRASRGCVINLSSGSSILPHPAMSGYAMAKEAIRVLTRVTALEWGRAGIRVNAIGPLAETPGWEFFKGETPGSEAQVLSAIALGRHGRPRGRYRSRCGVPGQ